MRRLEIDLEDINNVVATCNGSVVPTSADMRDQFTVRLNGEFYENVRSFCGADFEN